jgi:hypothetical protein
MALAIYDGQTLIGEVRQIQPGRFEAVDPSGHVLGIFSNQRAAAVALPSTDDCLTRGD